MQNKELLILQSDKDYAIKRINELTLEIQSLGPEFYDVFNQSSETWHDNAPFDALRDKQSLLDAELQNLRRILRNASSSLPKQNKQKVGIGCNVRVVEKRKGALIDYFIAGDWTAFAGSKNGNATIVSKISPIGEVLYDLEVGDIYTFKNKIFKIEDIKYS